MSWLLQLLVSLFTAKQDFFYFCLALPCRRLVPSTRSALISCYPFLFLCVCVFFTTSSMMKTILTVLCLVSWSNGLHGTTTEAFQHGGSPVRSLTTTTTTTTSLLAAISPDGFRKTINGKTTTTCVDNNNNTMKKTKKNNSKSANDGLRIKRDEVVLEPYYGIANGILLAAPILLLQHTCKCYHANCSCASTTFRRQRQQRQSPPLIIHVTHGT